MAASRIFEKNAEMSRIWQPVEPKARKTSGNPAASASKSLLSWLKVRSQARSSLADGMSNAAFGANFGMENILLGETPYCFGGFFQSIKIPSE